MKKNEFILEDKKMTSEILKQELKQEIISEFRSCLTTHLTPELIELLITINMDIFDRGVTIISNEVNKGTDIHQCIRNYLSDCEEPTHSWDWTGESELKKYTWKYCRRNRLFHHYEEDIEK